MKIIYVGNSLSRAHDARRGRFMRRALRGYLADTRPGWLAAAQAATAEINLRAARKARKQDYCDHRN